MKQIIQTLLLSLTVVGAASVCAQSATATGQFLGKPVNPVMAVELDAAPVRALPTTPPSASGMVGDTRGQPAATSAASPPMYTGVENTQSQGALTPTLPTGRKGEDRK
ncbi:MAG: hypothetical protein FGM44_09230 [Limnohabitans sp.]|jgi:hypothetical protein|nr:hypothetical protein [Limnohabitans sp.]